MVEIPASSSSRDSGESVVGVRRIGGSGSGLSFQSIFLGGCRLGFFFWGGCGLGFQSVFLGACRLGFFLGGWLRFRFSIGLGFQSVVGVRRKDMAESR
ncbi:hypothetical protein Hanom_Chr12g01132381 [Helianthus anomalus]